MNNLTPALCAIFTILLTLWNSEQKNRLLINIFVFHTILMKPGELVVHIGYYNFTKFHQNWTKNIKVLLIAHLSAVDGGLWSDSALKICQLQSSRKTCSLALYEKSFESSNFWLKKSIFLLFTQVRTLLNFFFKKVFRNWSLLLYELYSIHMLFFLWNFIQWMNEYCILGTYIFFSIFTMKKLISYVMLSSK